MKVDHVEGESINLINTSQVVPGESFPTNTEIGKANQINTFKQVYPKDNNFELRCFLQILSAMLLNKTLTKNSSSKTGLEWAAQSCVLWRDLSTKRSPSRQGENLSHYQNQVLLFLKPCSCHADKVKTSPMIKIKCSSF